MAKGKKTGGRRKGTPNRTTTQAREAFQKAFDGSGGVKALTAWANENPTEFYKLFSKLIPQDIAHSGEITGGGVVILPAVKSS